MYGADGAIRTHATYKVERISNPPQYHAMLTSAYCDVGAQEGIRTLTTYLSMDFKSTASAIPPLGQINISYSTI